MHRSVTAAVPLRSATVSQVHNTSELAALKKNHSVIFLIVHDEEIDHDWQRIFMKQAHDKALKAKFAVTTNAQVVEVCTQLPLSSHATMYGILFC